MWIRLDDSFGDNPKVDGLSDGAFRLYVLGLCYAGRNLTDGFVDKRRRTRLSPTYRSSYLRELVNRGLWEPVDGGWQIHGFLERNPSAAHVQAERERVKAWRERTRTETRTETRSKQGPDPTPYRGGSSSGFTPSNGAAPPRAAAPLKLETRPEKRECGRCDSTGWLYVDNDSVTPCPECRT